MLTMLSMLPAVPKGISAASVFSLKKVSLGEAVDGGSCSIITAFRPELRRVFNDTSLSNEDRFLR
jgi:hypothetical protein